MRRRHRIKRDQGSVELNLAAMLDMAFQLLTFFILTFRPAPIEGQLAVHLPPPNPIVNKPMDNLVNANPADPEALGGLDEVTLHIQVTADHQGDVKQLRLEGAPSMDGPLTGGAVNTLDRRLQTIFGLDALPFDRVQIAVEGQLRYGELMKIVDVCSHQKRSGGELVHKISFTEL